GWFILNFLRRWWSRPQLRISSQEVAYDRHKFGKIIDWSERHILIHGRPVMLVSGEFQYWRVPDKARWEPLLRLYRGLGLNCVGIPFHWGYHAPDTGVYYFDGNRDIDYLLKLCESLRIFVIAAPGPYIASDTQAGGIPLWLVGDRRVRLRHLAASFFKRFDPRYHEFSQLWLEAILPILQPYQITERATGPILAVQLENKLAERRLGFPLALADELKSLALAARACGITVPLLSTDPSEAGSFAPADPDSGGLGFVYWRNPRADGSRAMEAIGESWDPSPILGGMDHIEARSWSDGALASRRPLIISELQAGAPNPPCSKLTYDDVYTFLGAELTTILFESALAQGSSIISIYTPYGGTNWGTLGCPETYTSYDHAACIREYGHLSGQYRKLRLSLLFVRSFMDQLLSSERDPMPFTTVAEPDVINRCRLMTKFLERRGSLGHRRNQAVEFVFFRNLNDKECAVFDVQLNLTDELQRLDGHEPYFMSCQLPFQNSFIGLGNYTAACGLHLKLSTKPIYARHSFRRHGHASELWIVQASDSLFSGEMAFEGTVDSRGTLGIDFRLEDQGRITLMTFEEGPGWVALSQGNDEGALLYIVALEAGSLDTLYGAFRDSSWDGSRSAHDDTGFLFGWGAYNLEFDAERDALNVSYLAKDRGLVILLPEYEAGGRHPGFSRPGSSSTCPPGAGRAHPQFLGCEVRRTHFSSWGWAPLELAGGTVPTKSPLDLGFASGHCAYRCTFAVKPGPPDGPQPSVTLRLIGRHLLTVFFNGGVVGSHTTLSQRWLRPGTASGPELGFGERPATFDLSQLLVVLVDSLGVNQMRTPFDDARNPRGLKFIQLEASCGLLGEPYWQIAGVDVRTLANPYNTSGLPDEVYLLSGAAADGWRASPPLPELSDVPPRGVTWYRTRFRHPLADQRLVVCLSSDDDPEPYLTCPLNLQLQGDFVAYVWLNGYLVGRYHGAGVSPQDKFYLMDGLVGEDPDADNQLCLAVYALGPDSTLSAIKVAGYRVALDAVDHSGNSQAPSQGGGHFLLAHQSLPLPAREVCPVATCSPPSVASRFHPGRLQYSHNCSNPHPPLAIKLVPRTLPLPPYAWL
ncbi:hypothetical protein L0F63_005531, partial [Massospora cicadina]